MFQIESILIQKKKRQKILVLILKRNPQIQVVEQVMENGLLLTEIMY